MTEIISLASVKAGFSEIVDRVNREQDRVVVTRNGRPVVILISPEDLESLEETLAVLSSPELMAQIRESEQQIAQGEAGTSLEDLKARYLK